MKFLSLLGVEIEQNIYFAAAILKIQNGGHADISANVINDFSDSSWSNLSENV